MDGRVREPGRSEGCAASRGRVSPAQPGWTRKEVHGSTAYPTWKHGRDRSMPLTRCSSEDAWGEAPQDPRDMVKVTLPKRDHVLPVVLGGEDGLRQLLHGHCHDTKTAQDGS